MARFQVAQPMGAGELLGAMKSRRMEQWQADLAEHAEKEARRKKTIAAVGAIAGGVIGLAAAGAAGAAAAGGGLTTAGAGSAAGAGAVGAGVGGGAVGTGVGASAAGAGTAAAAGGAAQGGLMGLFSNPKALESIQMGMGLGKSIAGMATGDDYTSGVMNIVGQLAGRQRQAAGAGAKGFTLGLGQKRFGPGGQVIAEGGEVPEISRELGMKLTAEGYPASVEGVKAAGAAKIKGRADKAERGWTEKVNKTAEKEVTDISKLYSKIQGYAAMDEDDMTAAQKKQQQEAWTMFQSYMKDEDIKGSFGPWGQEVAKYDWWSILPGGKPFRNMVRQQKLDRGLLKEGVRAKYSKQIPRPAGLGAAKQPTIKRRGTKDGRNVVQLDDGRIVYADGPDAGQDVK